MKRSSREKVRGGVYERELRSNGGRDIGKIAVCAACPNCRNKLREERLGDDDIHSYEWDGVEIMLAEMNADVRAGWNGDPVNNTGVGQLVLSGYEDKKELKRLKKLARTLARSSK